VVVIPMENSGLQTKSHINVTFKGALKVTSVTDDCGYYKTICN
jgi:hypothetical protein